MWNVIMGFRVIVWLFSMLTGFIFLWTPDPRKFQRSANIKRLPRRK